MTTTADDGAHPARPLTSGDERALLQSWLDFHRQTLLWKCSGLTEDQLKTAAVPPSTLTLLGLVRHLAEVERGWFRAAAGLQLDDIYCTPDDLERDFNGLQDAHFDDDCATLRTEGSAADAAVADLPLEHTFANGRGAQTSLRWVYLHLIEEYARHNGHADLIRERIDGATGD